MVRRITLARIESKLPYLLKPHFFLFFTFSKGVPTCFLVRLASVCRNESAETEGGVSLSIFGSLLPLGRLMLSKSSIIGAIACMYSFVDVTEYWAILAIMDL